MVLSFCVYVSSRDVLGSLEILPFSLYGWRDNHLDFVHFFDGSGAAYSHPGAQSANQVLSTVGDGGGTKKNLLQRGSGSDFDACPSGQSWM